MKNRKLTEKRLLFIKKILFVLTILLLIYHVGWTIFILAYRHHIGDVYIKYVTTMIFRILQFSAMLLVLAAPKFLKKWFKINVPLALYIVIALFAFNALFLWKISMVGFFFTFPFGHYSIFCSFMVYTYYDGRKKQIYLYE